MARQAIILHEGSPGPKEQRLGRILDFFGVPWQPVDVSGLENLAEGSREYVAFGSMRAVATALNERQEVSPPVSRVAAFYAYANDEISSTLGAMQLLFRDLNLSLQKAPIGTVSLRISDKLPDIAGPMAGLEFSLRLRTDDAVLAGASSGEESIFTSVISAGPAPVFVRFQQNGVPVFLCTSSQIIDIDQPVGRGFYDVKDQFCSVVPLVMFIRSMFQDVGWQPQELAACLIIDDPLLKPQYGFCDFTKLRDLMRQHGFTTNIAFIPWNWRRTSSEAGDFFRNESGLFSVSIHGCDHTAGEFGAISPEVLSSTARLAQSRMRDHEARTGIRHEPIMVFPQGVFSSECPEVLKRNGFLAAVNTEVVPVDSQNARTRIRDVWDVAIMTYGGFPIFTRRYAFHGLENFAFDLLLGKPCLIVVHHDFFKDGGTELIDLVRRIGALNCSLHWRPLGEVIRRACRSRGGVEGLREVEMYGSELVLGNPSDEALELLIRKRKSQDEGGSQILCDEKPIKWTSEAEHLVFRERIGSHREKRFRIVYQVPDHRGDVRLSLRFKVSVAMRRMLCELRDEYLARISFLGSAANRLNSVFKKSI